MSLLKNLIGVTADVVVFVCRFHCAKISSVPAGVVFCFCLFVVELLADFIMG